MVSAGISRWIAITLLLVIVAGCGRMLPMGGRDELVKYTVSEGETLYSISWRYGYDYREVAGWNNIRPPYSIYPGQVLYIIAPHQQEAKPPRQIASQSETPSAPSNSNVTTRPAVIAASPDLANHSREPRAEVAIPPISRQGTRVEKGRHSRNTRGVEWHWPTSGIIINGFNPAQGKKGLDIRGKPGQEILAAAPGKVVYSGSGLIGYGNLVIIKHNETYLSAYGHNRKLLVNEGAVVKQGEKIAEMGDSGKDGIILHFEVRRDGKPVNPLTYLPKRRN
ncbi:MAG: peptidoglycan DD-metalloendopeptidase family protein [Chromatiales bacterium]|nr:peptidoglycan DD-metalloendopeptidase family protein [Chromatiales bacterium]